MSEVRPSAACLPVFVAGLVGLCSAVAGAAPTPAIRDVLTARMTSAPPVFFAPLSENRASGKIKHVVIIMQENRGFDNLFQGYPGADTLPYGYDSNGTKIQLQPVPLEAPYDIEHDISTYITACNGTGSIPGTNCQMNGFNNEPTSCGSSCSNPQYGYVPHSETTTYFNMASQYVLGDRMFTSHIDNSFISHQYIIAAQANGTAWYPSSTWGCDGGSHDTIPTLLPNRTFGSNIVACWDINTLGDELDAAKKSWRFYTSYIYASDSSGIWSAYQAIRHIRYGPDWTKDVITPQSQILTDVKNGFLANVTWVMPTCATSDHAGCGGNQGPAWVASVVNAIGQSKFWNSTAIFITWDEWGGWSDHVPPPYVDYDGLGMRVPLLIISPYAKKNYVSHVQYEQGSILRFTEDQFGLKRLSAADTRANSPGPDAFKFNQLPRPFNPFAASLPPEYFLHAPPDRRVPDAD